MYKLLIFCISVAMATVNADVHELPSIRRLQQNHYPQEIRILRQESEIDPQGNYQWAYDSENGISAQERGVVRQLPKEQVITAQGSYQYTSPEGVPVVVAYIADENGFQPQGDVLPTSPPVPQAILRSLEYIRTHPEPEKPFRRI